MKLNVSELKELIGENAFVDKRGLNLYGTCPKCSHNEFGISLQDNHRFGCFRKKECGFNGNIFTLLAFFGKSVREIKPGYEFKAPLENKIAINNEHEIDLSIEDCPLPIGFKRIEESEYLTGRGFEKKDFDEYKPGMTQIDLKFNGFIIFPIEQYGSVKGYVARNTKSKEEINKLNEYYKLKGIEKKVKRYLNSTSDFSKLLGGIEKFTPKTKIVVLVEGLFDRKNTEKLMELDEQEEVKCCCTWKCAMSAEQIFLLQQYGIEDVILLYDPDVIEDIKSTALELESYFNVLIGFNENGKDPGDMSVEDFDKVINNLQTPSYFTQKKLAVKALRRK